MSCVSFPCPAPYCLALTLYAFFAVPLLPTLVHRDICDPESLRGEFHFLRRTFILSGYNDSSTRLCIHILRKINLQRIRLLRLFCPLWACFLRPIKNALSLKTPDVYKHTQFMWQCLHWTNPEFHRDQYHKAPSAHPILPFGQISIALTLITVSSLMTPVSWSRNPDAWNVSLGKRWRLSSTLTARKRRKVSP